MVKLWVACWLMQLATAVPAGAPYVTEENLKDAIDSYLANYEDFEQFKLKNYRWGNYGDYTSGYSSTTPRNTITTEPSIYQDKINYKVLADRGMVMDEKGTLISYSSIDLMSVVIKIPSINESHFPENCSEAFTPIKEAYESKIQHYEDVLTQILKPTTRVKKYELCRWIGGMSCHIRGKKHRRRKRFVGAAMAATALVASAAALGLSVDNRIQINEVKNYLNEIADDLEATIDELKTTNDRQNKILKSQSKILGYIADISRDVETLSEMVECNRMTIMYAQQINSILKKLDEILVYPQQGEIGGRLMPSIISPEGITHTLSQSASNSMKQVLTHLPSVFYASAYATLIGYDLDNLVFQFLITYPLLEASSTVLPIYNVHQVGFHAKLQSNDRASPTEECVNFVMPKFATMKNSEWYTIEMSNYLCPVIGAFSICPETAFSLRHLSSCINVEIGNHSDTNSQRMAHGCLIDNCESESQYVNLKGGLLIRTKENDINLMFDGEGLIGMESRASKNIKIQPNKRGVAWVPWNRNVTAVQFNDKVVYNPMDPQFQAEIEELHVINASEIMSLAEIFDANFESARIIREIEMHQEELLNISREIEQSNAKLDTLGGFSRFITNPMHALTIPLIIAGCVIGIALVGYLFYKHCYQNNQRRAAINVVFLKFRGRNKEMMETEKQPVETMLPLNNIEITEPTLSKEKEPLPSAPMLDEEEDIIPDEQDNRVAVVPPMPPNPYTLWMSHLQQLNNIFAASNDEPTYSYINGACYK